MSYRYDFVSDKSDSLINRKDIVDLSEVSALINFGNNRWSNNFLHCQCFAFLIVSISSYYGYYVRGGSLDVGKASTQAIVTSSVVILMSNFILTKLLLF